MRVPSSHGFSVDTANVAGYHSAMMVSKKTKQVLLFFGPSILLMLLSLYLAFFFRIEGEKQAWYRWGHWWTLEGVYLTTLGVSVGLCLLGLAFSIANRKKSPTIQ